MIDIPDAIYRHKSSGRSRLKIPSKKGDIAYFSTLMDELSNCACIEKIEANPITGSVLFIYNGDFKPVLDMAEGKGIFRLKKFENNAADFHRTIHATFRDINNRIKHFTGGGLDLGALAFLSLLIAGIYQIGKGNFTAPAWYTAFWYALNIFLKSKPDKDFE